MYRLADANQWNVLLFYRISQYGFANVQQWDVLGRLLTAHASAYL